MKELLGQLIAQFLVDVITVHTDVAQITVTQQPCQDGMPISHCETISIREESCRMQRRHRIGARSLLVHRVTPRS